MPGGIADVVSLVGGAVTFQAAVLLPEPGTTALLALGLAFASRRRRA